MSYIWVLEVNVKKTVRVKPEVTEKETVLLWKSTLTAIIAFTKRSKAHYKYLKYIFHLTSDLPNT